MRLTTCLAIFASLAGRAALAADADFDSFWHDGKAELDGYRLTLSRYGEPRHGQAVLIYVTEPFSASQLVKADHPDKNPADVVDVLKLNLVRDFQTGIYDYNTMVSTFVRSGDFSPLKISFSSAEWCGHVYEELQFRTNQINGVYHSYFEGESGGHQLAAPADGVVEDNLWILLRGLRQDYLSPGKSKTVPYLPGVLHGRLAHQPLGWTQATIRRRAEPETLAVPAGKFEVMVYEVSIEGGRTGKFQIESTYPHRIIRWELLPDIVGELTGSTRLEYWRLHGSGDEKYLKELGLRGK